MHVFFRWKPNTAFHFYVLFSHVGYVRWMFVEITNKQKEIKSVYKISWDWYSLSVAEISQVVSKRLSLKKCTTTNEVDQDGRRGGSWRQMGLIRMTDRRWAKWVYNDNSTNITNMYTSTVFVLTVQHVQCHILYLTEQKKNVQQQRWICFFKVVNRKDSKTMKGKTNTKWKSITKQHFKSSSSTSIIYIVRDKYYLNSIRWCRNR